MELAEITEIMCHANLSEMCFCFVFSSGSVCFYLFTYLFIYVFIYLFYYCYSVTAVPIFSPLPSCAQPTPRSHSPSPYCSPCPWVIHTCSLSSPFPFFPPLSPSPMSAVSLSEMFKNVLPLKKLIFSVYYIFKHDYPKPTLRTW